MMRPNKLSAALLFLCVLLPFFCAVCAGCRKAQSDTGAAVVCTTYPVWLLTRSLMRGAENPPDLSLLIPPDTGCPHDYALSPRELLKVSGTKHLLLIRNGGNIDAAVFEAVEKANPGLTGLNASGLEAEHGHEYGHEHDHGHCHDHGHGPDPHMFAAPEAAMTMVSRIASGLAGFDAANAAVYRKNAEELLHALASLSARWKNARKDIPVLLMHDSFRRLAEEGGMRVEGIVFEGHISELSPAEVRRLCGLVRAKGIRLLIAEPQTPDSVAALLRSETGIRVLKLDPAASGPADVPMDHLIRTMERTIGTLLAKEPAK